MFECNSIVHELHVCFCLIWAKLAVRCGASAITSPWAAPPTGLLAGCFARSVYTSCILSNKDWLSQFLCSARDWSSICSGLVQILELHLWSHVGIHFGHDRDIYKWNTYKYPINRTETECLIHFLEQNQWCWCDSSDVITDTFYPSSRHRQKIQRVTDRKLTEITSLLWIGLQLLFCNTSFTHHLYLSGWRIFVDVFLCIEGDRGGTLASYYCARNCFLHSKKRGNTVDLYIPRCSLCNLRSGGGGVFPIWRWFTTKSSIRANLQFAPNELTSLRRKDPNKTE